MSKSEKTKSKRALIYVEKGSALFDASRFVDAFDCFEKSFGMSHITAQNWFNKWLDAGKLQRIEERVNPEVREYMRGILDVAASMRYFPKTSLTILRLAAVLTNNKETIDLEDFKMKADSILARFRHEFVEEIAFNRQYRRRCFDEVQMITMRTLGVSREENNVIIKELFDLRRKMLEIDETLRPMSASMADLLFKVNRSKEDRTQLFTSICFQYGFGVEALFHDVIRILYLCSEATRGNILGLEDMKKNKDFNIWGIKHGYKQFFGFTPIFLEGERLTKIIDIRNAIAHAQARYEPEADQAQFWVIKNGKETFYRMNLYDFSIVNYEVIDLIDSLRRSIDILLVEAFLAILYDAL